MIDRVAETQVTDNVRVSTVRIPPPLSPTWRGSGPRWETMIRGGAHDGEGEQYDNEGDAIAAHDLWVMVAKGAMPATTIHELRRLGSEGAKT
jgi:hypothetical protein